MRFKRINFTGDMVYQYRELGPGESGRVYRLKVPSGFLAAIQKVANRYYATQGAGIYYRWTIDGVQVEDKIERRIGNFYSPTEFDPPLWAKSEVEFYGYNPTVATYILEVQLYGYFLEVPKEEAVVG